MRAPLLTQDQVTCHYSSIHPPCHYFFFVFLFFYFASLSVREHSQRVPLSPSPASILECRRSAWNGREPPSPWAGREREVREQTGEGDGRRVSVCLLSRDQYLQLFCQMGPLLFAALPPGPYRHTYTRFCVCLT